MQRFVRFAAAITVIAFAHPAIGMTPAVVTDIPPVHSLVAQVMGGLGEPVLLLGRGSDAHDYQMRPSDAAALAGADLVVWLGPEMTPWLARALGGEDGKALGLLHAPGTFLQPFAAAGQPPGDVAAKPAAGAAQENEGAADPHAFLDPDNAELWLRLIAERLAALDPHHAEAYRRNARAAADRAARTDAEAKATLAVVAGQPIIVFHEAFGYFARHYALNVVGSVSLGDAADPGAARLSRIRSELGGIRCIFPEAGHDPKLIQTLADGTGAKIGPELDPEGRAMAPGPDLYDQLLTNLARAIAACAGDP